MTGLRAHASASPVDNYPRPRRGARQSGHLLLALQRQAGNAAVTKLVQGHSGHGTAGGVVQRQLAMTGPSADIKAALALLSKASGLILSLGKKNVVALGKQLGKQSSKAQPPKSATLAAQLAAILTDTGRTAQVLFGNDPDVSFGAFPASADDPVQRLVIADFLALEKALPGHGAAKLAHEIVENFQAQSHRDLNWTVAFDVSHRVALAAENKVLAELEVAYGQTASGDRWNTYPVSLKTAATPANKGTEATGGSTRVVQVEVHANDYIVTESGAGPKGGPKIIRVAAVPVKSWSVEGFGAKSTAVPPKSAASTLAAVAKVLDTDPTASVVIRTRSEKAAATEALRWSTLVQEGVTDRMTGDVIVKSWRRFHHADPIRGPKNAVEIVVRRPAKL